MRRVGQRGSGGAAALEAPGEKTRQQGQAETTGQRTAANIDWNAVGQAIGKEGELREGGVYRVSLPRKDLNVISEGVKIDPSLALGSYAAFFPTGGNEALLRGDLVLTEEEYNRVISRLQEGASGRQRSTSTCSTSLRPSGGRTLRGADTRLRWPKRSAPLSNRPAPRWAIPAARSRESSR